MKKLRTAVIGVGYMGRFHAGKLAACADAELVAVADTDAARAKDVAAALGCAHETDYRRLLSRIDAACVAVPTEHHHAVVRACLEAGVHVLVEKPLSRTLEEADALLALARAKALVLQVGHLQRFNPAFRALEAQGGRPLFIDIERLAPFKARAIDVDVVLDLMIHDLDLLLWFDGTEPKSVDAVGVAALTDKIDIANARIRFASGCVANVTASRISAEGLRRIRVFQARTYLGCDTGERKVERFRLMIGSDKKPTIQHELLPVDDGEPLALELAAFLHAVQTRTPPPIDGLAGRRALELACRVREAIASSGPA